MADGAVVVLAAGAAAGAWVARPVPLAVGGALASLGLWLRRPTLLWVGVALLASALGARAWAGLTPPAPRDVDAVVTLVGDPSDGPHGAARADVRLGGRRVELWARGAAADALRRRLAGERVAITGRLAPLPPRVRAWLAPRHVAGRVTADAVADVGPATGGSRFTRFVNALRRALGRGASVLPDDRRPLFTGLVIGDDRGQRPEIVDDFRASGLSHLLVMSGQNVAYALAAAGLVLRRLTLGGRLVAGLIVLATFGTLTRWEPSVVRAIAMAAIALVATVAGRPQPGLRVLALAVTAVVLVDPLLVRSVGFQLSVAASAGILVLAPPLARRLPGPRPVATAAAVTLAAQAGVAPVLVPTFGGVPAASLPANLLAAPAAGPVVLWGMSAGLVAGVAGGRVAAVLHLPTRVLVGWIAGVARVTARLPMATLGWSASAVLLGAVVVGLAGRRRQRALARSATGVAVVVAAAVVLLPVWRPPPTDLTGADVAPGARVWRAASTTVLVLDGAAADATDVLDGLRAAGVGAIDVLAVAGVTDAVGAVRVRHRVGFELDAATTRPGTTVVSGGFTVVVDGAGGVQVRPRPTEPGVERRAQRSSSRRVGRDQPRGSGFPAASHASTAAVGSRPRSPSPFHSDCVLADARQAARSCGVSSSAAAGARFRAPPARAPPAPARPTSRAAPLRRTICASNSSRWARHRSSSHRRPSNPNSTVCAAPVSSSWRSHVRTIETFLAIEATV
jgi:competence protein ComEC